MTRITAIANQKGGVGKTALSVNLAVALAEAGRSTLLIDLDPQNHCAEQLGANISDGRWLTEVFKGEITLRDAARKVQPRLWLVPAGEDGLLAGVEQALITETAREQWLAREMAGQLDALDEVLLDCAPNLGQLTVNGLVAADQVITPVKMKDRGAGTGARQLGRTIELLTSRGFDVPAPILVRNLIRDSELACQAMEAELPTLKFPIARTRILERAAIANAGMEAVPVLLRQPREEVSNELRRLAGELFGIDPMINGQEALAA
jgi:chromosome partitioning protein